MTGAAEALTPAWYPMIPHPERIGALLCPKRFVGVVAGRASGKTDMALRRLVAFLRLRREWVDPRYFYAADTLGKAYRIAWERIIRLTPRSWIQRGWPKSRRDALELRTIWGSSLWLFGLHKPSVVEGLQFDGGVVDESCDCPPGAFDRSILPTLTHRMGWAWRMGVPKRQGIGAAEFRAWCDEASSGRKPDRALFAWESAEILDKINPELLRFAAANMDPKDFREQYQAKWETAGGNVFYAFDRQVNIRPCPYQHHMPIVVGSDFNVDPMSWCLGHAYPTDRLLAALRGRLADASLERLEWFDELRLRDTSTPKTLDTLWARYSDHPGGWIFIGDATSRARDTRASVTDYQQIVADRRFKPPAGVPEAAKVRYPMGNPPRADRFSWCNARLCDALGVRRMFVDPRCRYLVEDLEARYYKPGTNEPADPRGSGMGHMTDAMGYVVAVLFRVRPELVSAPPRAGVCLPVPNGRGIPGLVK